MRSTKLAVVSVVLLHVCALSDSQRVRVVNGHNATVKEFPYIVGILFNSTTFPYCGGSFISPLLVVSAAHCVYKHLDPSLYTIGYGESLTAQVGKEKNVSVKKIHVHPGYEPVSYLNDVAVFELAAPIPVDVDSSYPIRVNFDDRLPQAGSTIQVSGWGSLYYLGNIFGLDIYPVILQAADLEVQPLIISQYLYSEQTILDAALLNSARGYGNGCTVNNKSYQPCSQCYGDPYTSSPPVNCFEGGIFASYCLAGGGSPENCRVGGFGPFLLADEGLFASYPSSNPSAFGSDACQGDSGGPVASTTLDGAPLLVGLTSFAYGCGMLPLPGAFWRTSQAGPFLRTLAPHGTLPWDVIASMTLCRMQMVSRALTCEDVISDYSLPLNTTCAKATAAECSLPFVNGLALTDVSGFVMMWYGQEGTDFVDYEDTCARAGLGFVCYSTANITQPDLSIKSFSSKSFDGGNVPSSESGVVATNPMSTARCPWNSKTFSYNETAVLASCFEAATATRDGSMAQVLVLNGCGFNDTACCESVLSSINCDELSLSTCSCGNSTEACTLRECAAASNRGLYGLLGLLILVPAVIIVILFAVGRLGWKRRLEGDAYDRVAQAKTAPAKGATYGSVDI